MTSPLSMIPATVQHNRDCKPSSSAGTSGGLRALLGSLAFALVLVLLAAATARAAPPMRELVRADLIAEPSAITPGKSFLVAVRLRLKDGWHVYWRNPGDSGEAPTITWKLPTGFTAGPIQWPAPQRIPIAHLANFGYEHEVVLLTELTAPASAGASGAVPLAADVSWLVCQKECIPGEASLSLSLPYAAADQTVAPNPDTRATFDAARAALPKPAPWPARLELSPDWVTLLVEAKGLKPDTLKSALFFPNAETLIEHAAPQTLHVDGNGLSVRMKRSALSTAPPADGGGVLVIDEALGTTSARNALSLASVSVGAVSATPRATASLSLILQAALGALLGGIILNLMPCVFPVLSIKVLGLIKHGGTSATDLHRHGLAYAAGVLVAFAALTALLLGLRAAGNEIGWGFQLQSPLTIIVLAYVLMAMALSLSGVFYFASGVPGAALMQRAGLPGSFFAGALAAVVATPCTAPFMGAAVGFALTQPGIVAGVVMLCLGLGLALPFLALTWAPGLIARLPRPGPWMETLKQILAFPLYATVAWLVWVLSQQVSPGALLVALGGLVLVGLAAWSFNAAQTAGMTARRVALGATVVSLAGTALAMGVIARDAAPAAGPGGVAGANVAAGAERFTQARLDALISEKRPVFVNLTAAWCITCLVNERVALATEAVRDAFARSNVAYLKGDWTNRDPEITRLLEKYGRSGVPLYLLYAEGSDPTILPQILTPATVLEHIDRISAQRPQRRASLSNSNISTNME